MESQLPSREIVLIGAGHTNLHVVRMWRMQPIPDVQLTVVSPFGRATYSGMLPGTLAGLYGPDEMQIDLYRLTQSCGVRLIVDEVVGFDAEARRIHFADRPALPFDVASIGIGSVPLGGEVWTRHRQVLSIKPMQTFLSRLEAAIGRVAQKERKRGGERERGRDKHREAGIEAGTSRSEGCDPRSAILDPRSSTVDPSSAQPHTLTRVPAPPADGEEQADVAISVVGAGAAGVEVTLCLDAWLRRQGRGASLTLVETGEEILPGYAEKTVRLARRELKKRGVTVRVGLRAEGFADGRLLSADGRSHAADVVIWAAGAAPPPVLENFELPKADDGFLAVRPTLQTLAEAPVFVVGDTATLAETPLPKAGVYAVREGPVLWENVHRFLQGRELKRYDPQSGFLSLLATGDGRAIAQYKGLAAHGRWVWILKDYIDRKFMRKHQDYRPMTAEMMAKRAAARHRRREDGQASETQAPRLLRSSRGAAPPKMRCRGCGGKVGANVLAAALRRLELPHNHVALYGLDRADDAAILAPDAGTPEVVSVDFFQAFLDDHYLVGRVAALNALSDLWASGARPVGAMAMVSLPEGKHERQAELLYQLLAGGVREFSAAGAALLGGHTTEGAELTLGYTVFGKLDGRPPFLKANLRPGDRLILTKPLGTGVLLAGHAVCAARAEWMQKMLESMLSSNASAAAIARELNVAAVTDVTGFGLAGHLLEMLEAGRVEARISLDALPLLEGYRELAGEGVRSSLFAANRESEDRIECRSNAVRDAAEYSALFDPQTSGGLLIAVPDHLADVACKRLEEAGYPASAVVGEVLAESTSPVLHVAK